MGISLGDILGAMPQGLKIIGALLLLVSVMGLYYAVITLLDLAGGSVQIREGRGMRTMTTSEDDDGSTTTRTYYVVDGQKFTVSKKGFSVLENGRNYRVYFTPRRKILVNIEAVD
jgi:hypothetical protein